MNRITLIMLRGKIKALEMGPAFGAFDAKDVLNEVDDILTYHPDLPGEEKRRLLLLRQAALSQGSDRVM